MKKLFNFLYAITVIFTVVGGSGYLFYYKTTQYARNEFFDTPVNRTNRGNAQM